MPRAGSRKAEVYERFLNEGALGATAEGNRLGLKPATIRTWIATWARQGAGEVPSQVPLMERAPRLPLERQPRQRKPKHHSYENENVRIVQGSTLATRYWGSKAFLIGKGGDDPDFPYRVRLHDNVETCLAGWEFEFE